MELDDKLVDTSWMHMVHNLLCVVHNSACTNVVHNQKKVALLGSANKMISNRDSSVQIP